MRNHLYFVTFVAALGGLMFGFETAVINGTIFYVQQFFGFSEAMKGVVVSMALVGCIIGALFIGKPGDIFGRRQMLKVMAVMFLLSMIGAGLATNLTVFITARLIGGIAVGGASVLTPMYISEIAPPKLRGRLVATNQLAIVTGILMAFFSNYIIDSIGHSNWRLMFLAGTIPSGVYFLLLFFIDRSPRWLVKMNRIDEALAVIHKVNPHQDAEIMMNQIRDSLDQNVMKKYSFMFKPPYLKLVLIGIAVGMFNQMAGINVIMYYSTDIFRVAGFSAESAMFQSVLIGITNLAFTIVAMIFIDRFGRNSCFMWGLPVCLYFSGCLPGRTSPVIMQDTSCWLTLLGTLRFSLSRRELSFGLFCRKCSPTMFVRGEQPSDLSLTGFSTL
ncbi:sugar porter family MFS transporter [Prolixibacter bellariivorans]|uniref:sugar porter family MFS transporter n=1 Tax=Prolixibacter bellariivorans TaxID=314319 RepID=UPI0006873468|nr:sugar porter family MFS transporter [Prolixibacter bellariivorans]